MKHISSVQTLLGWLVAGLFAGILVSVLYYEQKSSEAVARENELVDFVISSWTLTGDREVVEVDSVYLSQLKASVELPTSRLGYFPDTVRTLAMLVQERYQVPASVTLAQWALESRWGKNNLGVSNYFGHTFPATKRFIAPDAFVLRRDVVAKNGVLLPGPPRKFASYKNIAECFDVHGRYLSQSEMYRAAFYTSTPENFARVIALRYAQDPDYSVKLITIIRRYKL